MKIRKGFITTVFIVLLTAFAIFPAQSEAAYFPNVAVYNANVVVTDEWGITTNYDYTDFNSSINISGNTIGTLLFYNTTPYNFTAGASVTTLTVKTGAQVSLYSLVSTNVTVESGGTIQNNISTSGTVTVDGGTLGEGVANSSLVEATTHSIINSTFNAVLSTSGNVNIENSSITAGGVGIHSTDGSVEVIHSVISADQDAILYTNGPSSNVTVTNSLLLAGLDGITETDGSVNVTYSSIYAYSDAIFNTGKNVTVTESELYALVGNGISNTGGSVTVTDSTIDAGSYGIGDTAGNVTVTGSVLGATHITGSEGIVNTSGDLTVTKSYITATNGDAIRGVSGDVVISDSSITAYGGSGVVLDGAGKVSIENAVVSADVDGINISNNGAFGNEINNLDITAGRDGLVVENTSSLTVNLTTDGVISADRTGIYTEGSTNLAINSPNGDSTLSLTTGGDGIEVAGGATLKDNVETYITTTGDNSSGVSVRGYDSNANFAKYLSVYMSGDNSIGIETMGGGVFNASEDVYIYSSSDSSVRGIYARDPGSSVTVDGLTKIEIYADDSKGIEAAEGGAVHLNDANVNMDGSGMMRGLYASYEGSSINVSGDLDVYVHGETFAGGLEATLGGTITADSITQIIAFTSAGDAYGVWADEGSTINAKFNDLEETSISVSASNGNAYGVAATSETQNSYVVIENAGDINVGAEDGNAYGLYADPSTISGDAENITVSATGDAYGAYAYDSSTIDVEVSDTIDVKSTESGLAIGIGANDGSYTKISGLDVLTVSAEDGTATGIYAEAASSADVLMDEGTVTVTSANGNAYGVHVLDNSNVTLEGAQAMVITASEDAYGVYAYNNSDFSGDIANITVNAGGDAFGVYAELDSGIVLELSGDVAVMSTGGDALGIGAETSGDVTVEGLGNLIVNAVTGYAGGIGAEENSVIDVSMLGDITVIAGDSAIGITATGYSSADVSMTGKVDVLTISGDATGIGAEDNSYAILRMDADKTDNDIIVRTNAGNAYGMVASGDSDIVFENVRDLVVTTASGDAYGLFANDPSTISGDVESITVSASGNAYGAYAYSESTIDAAMSGDITVTSVTGDAYGINAEDYSSADVTMTGDILVMTAGTGESLGVAASNNSGVTLSTEGGITVESENGDSYGIGAEASYVTVTGLTDLEVTVATAGEAYGIIAYDNSTIDVSMTGDITVDTADGDAVGVAAHNGSEVYLTGAGAMEVSAANGDAYGLLATSGAIISADVESIEVTASDNAYGIGGVLHGEVEAILSGDITVMSTSTGRAVGIGTDVNGVTEVRGLEDLFVTTVSGDVAGIGADNGGYTKVEMNGDITVKSTTAGDATGIGADGYGDVIVTGLENIIVTANEGNAAGLAANGGNIKVSMSGDITVGTLSGHAFGVFAYDDSQVYLTGAGAMVVSAADGHAFGVSADDDAEVYLTGAGAMEVSAANGDAYGLLATSGAIISADLESIEVTASDNAYGIGAVYSGKIEAILNGDVTVMSTSIGRAVGIGTDHDGFTEVRGLEDLFVTTVSGDAIGIGADNGGYTEVEMNGDITVKSTVLGQATGIGVGEELGGYVIVTGLQDMYVDANAGPAIGIAAQYGASAEVEMDGTAYVETQAGPAFGIYAYDGSEVKLTGGNLDVTGASRVRGLYAEEDAGIHMTDGDIAINDITDSAYMEVYNGGAIYLSGVTANTFEGEIIDEDRTLITTDSYGTLSADMGTVIGGNMIHTGIESGDLDITITGGSKIIGAASADISNDEARINITLDSLADTWEVTADSYTNGTLTNRGIVDYRKVESLLDYNDGIEPGDFKTVTVYDFVGNDTSAEEDETGILRMKADINGGLNDLLIAEGSAEGVNRLEIQNLTNSGVERSGTLVLVEDDETDLELSIANPDEINAFGQYLIHAGAWSYELVSEEPEGITKEWYLERYSLTSTGVGIVSSMVNADVWYRETDTLLNRMGIYRDGDYYGGFWFEAAANKQETDGGFGSQYDQQFTNFTVGWDKMYEKEKGDLFIGIMGGYGKADRDIGSIGTTDLESTHAALYGIYRTHDGFYATGLVKYNKYDNDMSLFGVDKFSSRLLAELGEDRVKGNWDQDGYGISLQIGKRMDRENGWYLEPQAQLSWMRINGENYRTNTGIEVGIDDADSFRGRLGLLVGRTMQLKDETKLDLFGSLSLVHEFDGKTDITMSGGKWTSDLSGTWGVIGAGFNWNFQPGKYVHGGVSYATGDNRDEPWGVYLGLSIELGGSRPAKEKTEEAEAEAVTETEPATETSSEPAVQTGSI